MKKILAELLTIGDEILYGQIVDTNSQWMSVELDKIGIKVIRKTTVGDQEDEILTAFAEAEKRADVVLITGGLGPTNDDLTKPCLAKYFNCGMVLNEEALAEVTEFFKSRGRELTEVNRLQAMLPTACEKITNQIGTAPGMWFPKGNKVFMSMPGVPHEMKMMMTDFVLPRLKATFKTPIIYHKVVRTIGVGESILAEKIADWENALPEHIGLAYLPSLGEVKLRITGFGDSHETLEQEINGLTKTLEGRIGQFIFGYGDEPIESVIGKKLLDQKLTLSIAESCTGGYLSHLITSIPGSSGYFLGSIVPYDYQIKMRQLGVKPETLEKYGAVSEPTIIEMANIVRAKFNTDIGVATSGIAGPGGATPDKPVGTVWIAYSDKHQTVTKKLQLSKDRMINIRTASIAVLNLIRQSLPKSNTLLMILMLLSFLSYGQVSKRDSLIRELQKHPEQDTVRVNLLNAITHKSWTTDPHKNFDYAMEALKLSESLNFPKGIAASYREIASYYWSQTDYASAMDYALLAQEVYRKLGNLKGVSWSYGMIGLNYSQANNYEKAIEYHKKALELDTRMDVKTGIARDLNNLGYTHELMKDFIAARDYYVKALNMRLAIGDSAEMILPFLNVGAINSTLENYPVALDHLSKAQRLAKKFNNNNMIALIDQNFGSIDVAKGNYTSALEHYQAALKLAHQIGDKKRKENVYDALRIMEESRKNYQGAYAYAQRLQEIRDTLYTQEQTMKMAEMEARTEREKQAQAIQLLEKDKRIQTLWTNILIAGFVLVMLAFVLTYSIQQYRDRKNREFLNIQIDLLTSQNEELSEKYKQAITGTDAESVESADQRLLRKALEVVEKNIADRDFNVERMAEEMAMSRVNLHRKMKTITGFAPSEFIRNVRLKRAANLLRNHADSVSQIGYSVGFEDQSYFSKTFKREFGVSPSEYRMQS